MKKFNLLYKIHLMLLLICIPVMFGCGEKSIETNETIGTVTCDGTPVAGATVNFTPVEGNVAGQVALAVTGADGTYSMRIVSGEGVPAGKYKVSIQPKGFGGPVAPEFPWLEKYCSTEKSGLEAEVIAGKNTLDFALDKK